MDDPPVAPLPGPPTRVGVRAMTGADTATTAALHRRELPHGFFSQLGPGFLRVLHRAYLASPHAVALVATPVDDPGHIVGFLLASTDSRRHRAFVLRTARRPLLYRGLLGLARRPALVPRFARRRAGRYLRRLVVPARQPAPAAGGVAVISAIVVTPHGRGSGAGRALTEVFLTAARGADSRIAMLVTRADNTAAAAFWDRLGWSQVETHRNLDGDPVRTFTYPLT